MLPKYEIIELYNGYKVKISKKQIQIGKQKQKAYYKALDKYNKTLQELLKAQIEFDNALEEAYEACDDPHITYDEYTMAYEDALNKEVD